MHVSIERLLSMLHGTKINLNSNRRALTLTELIVAVLLLSAIILAGYSVELAMRRMNVRPQTESRLLDELIPIMNSIERDFEFYANGTVVFGQSPIGSMDAGVCQGGTGHKGLKINTTLGARGYCWRGTTTSSSHQIWYHPNADDRNVYDVVGYGVTNFDFDLHPWLNGTRLSVIISTRKNPALSVDPLTNPETTLNTTFYARGVSQS